MSPKAKASRRDAARGSASVFAALGDETRLSVVHRLCKAGPMSIARLTQGSDVTRQAITKHLQVLEDAGLVRGIRQGREKLWELEPLRLEVARRWLDLISTGWDEVLGRLKRSVER